MDGLPPPVPPPPVPKRPERQPDHSSPSPPAAPPASGQCLPVPSLNAYKKAPLVRKLELPDLSRSSQDSKVLSPKPRISIFDGVLAVALGSQLYSLDIMSSQLLQQTAIEHVVTCAHAVGATLWIGTADGSVLQHDIRTLQQLAIRPNHHSGRPVEHILPYLGEDVLTIDGAGVMIRWRKGELSLNCSVYKFPHAPKAYAVLEDGKILSSGGKCAYLYSIEGKLAELSCYDPATRKLINVAQVSHLLVHERGAFSTIHEDGKAIVWQTEAKDAHVTTMNISSYRIKAAVQRDANHSWLGFSTGRISVFGCTPVLEVYADWKLHECAIVDMALDGRFLASIDEEGGLYIWDANLQKARNCTQPPVGGPLAVFV